MAAGGLSKISRPVLYEPVARERLFDLLDQCSHPAVWIRGPPGSGKTTLVASWLQARRPPAVWYQVDAGDQDPATFFYYLGLAGRALQRKQRPLPLLTRELSRDTAAFAHGYFSALFSRLGVHDIVVLDNLHELPEASVLYPALARSVEDIAQGGKLILISRDPPHPAFAHLEANRALSTINADQLKFTLPETELLLSARAGLNRSDAQELQELCHGWAAGLSLLIERRRRGELLEHSEASATLQEVFDYFTEQVFARIAASDQRILLRLADLPGVISSAAAQASGGDDALRLMDDLYRRNLFVDRLLGGGSGKESSYQFHSLFRTFLRGKARAVFDAGEIAATRRTLARLLRHSDAVEDAFTLLVEACDWDAAAEVIYEQSGTLLRQGRNQMLCDWVAKLPTARVANDPWLLHWSGIAHVGIAPAVGRGILERAYVLATAVGDGMCRVQSVAGIIESVFLEYADFAGLDPWIELLDGLLPTLTFTDANAELRVYAALVGAALPRQGDSPVLQGYVTHTLALLREADNPNLKAAAAAHLLRYGVLVGRMAITKQAHALVQPVLCDPDVTPLRKGLCEQFVAWYHVNVPQEDLARDAIHRIEQRAREDNLSELRRFAAITGYWLEMSHLRSAQAANCTQALEAVMNPANAFDAGCLAGLKAWSCAASGDATTARRYAAEAVALFDEAGSCWHRIFSRGILGWTCAEAKDYQSAMRVVEEARRFIEETNLNVLDAQFDQIEAIIAAEQRADVQELLRRLFSSASRYGTGLPLRFFPTVAPRLCALALKSDIEVPYVRALIRSWGWRSEDATAEEWPWPVRVYTLGRFEVHVRDERINFCGHAPRKVLSLLKALLCLGVKSVRDRKLINALWSGDEADAGKAAFNVTLHRLRKFLQHPDAIAIQDGLVTLNTEVCWVDAVAFERLLQAPRRKGQIERALALYRGNLLPEDDEEPWSSCLREKLRRNFLHEVVSAGDALESSQQWHDAIELYQRALNADNLVEAFHRGLMRCYRALNRTSEAISVYQRMQRLFSITLGIEPSAESEVLYRSLFAAVAGSAGASPGPSRGIAR